MTKLKLVVVGNGMAGARAVEEVLSRGGADQFDIVMFGDEPYGNYNRILLSNILSGAQDASEIFINPLDWYAENNITLHAGSPVVKIDRAARIVTSEAGVEEPYDKLLIATGSRAFIPPIPGVFGPDQKLKSGVFGFRNIDDCNGIVAQAQKSARAAVIGGGLLGLEAARGLLNHGCEVHVVHLSKHLMEMQLDAPGGALLKASMEKMGVNVHLEKSTTEVLGDGHVSGLAFKDGSTIECDMLVVAAGIRPNAEIGRSAGLTVERAIVVDNHMRAIDDPDVYVVGECAQHRGKVYGLVAPLWEQGKVFADHITQRNLDAAYHGSKLATKLKVMGVELASMGITEPLEGDELIQFSEPKKGTYKKLIVRDGRLVGGILMGDISKAAFLMQAFDRDSPLPEERLSLLFDFGAPSQKVTIDEMPADMQVCNCNGVTKSAIGGCVASGAKTTKAVMDATRAGKGCGSCKSLVGEVVEWFCGGAIEEDPSVHYYVPGVPLTKPQLIAAAREQGLKSVSSVFQALAGGVEDAASKPALASLLATIWADEYDDERDARFINDRVHGNIQKDGTFSVVPEMPGGVCTPDELMRIASVAVKYNVPLVKLTGGQRIDLVGIPKDQLPGVWSDLGMPAGSAWGKSYRTCKSCIGTEFCRFGLGDSMGLAAKIEKRFRGIDSPAKLKLATTGCPRNCSEALIKDVGFVAVGDGKWELYIGGAGGAHVRKGDLMCTVDSEEDAIALGGRFMQYYRENAKWRERTYDFVPRIGIERIRAVIVDDSDGIADALDAAMQASVDAAYDPWKEALAPKTANQFASVIEAAEA
ncbi:nitrite reductase (NAD(P)H), large subunit [Methylocella silvestris BL2]|uniref:Nitrite reductase (NAD(P)H), large subunit n=1 Tax=Methylocella silvestris (strain DSM 15510 / CIP 108128 / LMG 27833 / NCIMB 13906 / BL2) TaxID=395965 RepID=B8EJG4_METSB|nr:nitrite reductase large subunit NirB [Methylocella silvestris]ACK52656.1 nitrite reductase (NAD(P)H), large subunit [Methylocella silvestris BL2]